MNIPSATDNAPSIGPANQGRPLAFFLFTGHNHTYTHEDPTMIATKNKRTRTDRTNPSGPASATRKQARNNAAWYAEIQAQVDTILEQVETHGKARTDESNTHNGGWTFSEDGFAIKPIPDSTDIEHHMEEAARWYAIAVRLSNVGSRYPRVQRAIEAESNKAGKLAAFHENAIREWMKRNGFFAVAVAGRLAISPEELSFAKSPTPILLDLNEIRDRHGYVF